MAMKTREKSPWQIKHPNAAGIDVGSTSHYVAVPADRCENPVREFSCHTQDLQGLADWLIECGVDTVALEATGVYWIALYELLEHRGLKVCLTDARRARNVSGRKSDVIDCQWLQQLMTYGLLNAAFRPAEQICAMRTVMRERGRLISEHGRCTQLMQKALTQMNVQLTNVLSDIAGKTGLAIIRRIVAGERDGCKLAALRDYRAHASEEEIARSLQGNWRAEHLLCLGNALELFDAYQRLIDQADQQLQGMLASVQRISTAAPASKKRGGKHAPGFDARTALYQCVGVDLTQIGGIDVSTALTVLLEIGWDLSKFKSAKYFASWLGLCPGTRITGGKRIGGATKRTHNRAAQALKLAAQGLQRSTCSLGAFYRKKAARLGAGKAITATAHKLARLIYAMLTKGEQFVQRSEQDYELQHRDRTLRQLERKAALFGLRLEPAV